jgi:hypothetical protein
MLLTTFAPAAAEPPDIIRSLRVIPSRSTLHQTGGFAGIDLEYTLSGTFDLVTGYEPSPLAVFPPVYVPFAQFENVDVRALNTHRAVDAFPVPLSRFVDLESLWGTFERREPHRLIFHGFDQEGQRFDLLAVLRDRLLHMVGASREQCCDFFQYKIDALAHLEPFADFNLDGMVDHLDSGNLLANIGTLSGATFEQGDANGDGDVDGDDLITWQQQIGASFDPLELATDTVDGLGGLSTAVVPEPATLVLFLLGWAALGAIHRHQMAARGGRRY